MSEHTPLTEAERVAEVLAEHAYIPSGLRGVSRCACGEQFHGMPHDHRAHVTEALVGLLAEAEIRGQMRHITAEMVRGDQPLEDKEELIADLRARLSHAEAERDDALLARTFDQPCTDDSDFAAMGREVGRRLAARTSTATADTDTLLAKWAEVMASRARHGRQTVRPAATADTGLRERVEAELRSEDATAVLYGVVGTHPDSYGGVTKDEALERAGELLTRLRALVGLDATPASTEDRADGEGTR